MGAVAALLVCAPAWAGQTTLHTSFTSFQNSTRASVILQTFDGVTATLPLIAYSENGFQVTVDSSIPSLNIYRDANGVGSTFGGEATEFTFSGRPVTAFAAFFRVTTLTHVPTTGAINLFFGNYAQSFNVPIGGIFIGITTSEPFSSMRVDAQPNTALEAVDDVRVGVAAIASEPADQCSDATTIAPTGLAAQYPFSTDNTGATALFIPGSCASSPSFDNGPDVWLRLVAPQSGVVTLSTCGATFDTLLPVVADWGIGNDGSGATQLACNEDFCVNNVGSPTASQVQFRVQAGEDYLIRISGYNTATGSGVLSYSLVPDCRADFNHSGGAQSVQDIFDFLNAWFGGC